MKYNKQKKHRDGLTTQKWKRSRTLDGIITIYYYIPILLSRSTPVAQSAPRNLLTRWDVSSIPANGIFLTKN